MTTDIALFDTIREQFERESGLVGLKYKIATKSNSKILVFYVSHPTERLFSILEDVRDKHADEDGNTPIATLTKRSPADMFHSAEIHLLLRVLTESQNVNRYTFSKDFFERYTTSVAGAETQIVSDANHVVLGRRGAGKSMLLLYAWHDRKRQDRPSVWIDMQVYSGREDSDVIGDVLVDVLNQVREILHDDDQHRDLVKFLSTPGLGLHEIRKFLPKVRRYLNLFAAKGKELFVFLDDLHVVSEALQPQLLDTLYAVSRGNRVFLKISAIETLVRTYDQATRQGLEVPQYAQNLRLDYNLTTPDKASAQIQAILDAHAVYSGLPSIRRLCSSPDVLTRLTWVSAGVPRDALNLFSQAISKATTEGRGRVTVSNVNVAASETVSIKLQDFAADASQKREVLEALFESIKRYCVQEKRMNAFLVEVQSTNNLYGNVMQLVELRLLHVISEGITVGKVGRKYIGLILDYGLYTGIRAAQSVELFNRPTRRVAYKELRGLPIFKQN